MLKELILFISIILKVNAEYNCYSCVYADDTRMVYSGINHACYGEKIDCNIIGQNCDLCWSDDKYSSEISKYCSSNSVYFDGKYREITYRVWNKNQCRK